MSLDRSSLDSGSHPGTALPRNPLPPVDASSGATPAPPAKSDSKTRGRGKDVMTPYIYSDWNAPSITCLFLLLENEGDTMLATEAYVCAVSNITIPFFIAKSETRMLAIRLYVSALTFFFLFVVIAHRGLGILEAVVIAGTILFLILDTRIDLRVFKNELRLLQNLEKQLSLLQSWKVQR